VCMSQDISKSHCNRDGNLSCGMCLIYWLPFVLTILPSIMPVKALSLLKWLYLLSFHNHLTAFDIETRAVSLVNLLDRHIIKPPTQQLVLFIKINILICSLSLTVYI